MKNIIKKIWIEIKPKKDIYVSSIFFGFLIAYAMIAAFFMFEQIIKAINSLPEVLVIIIPLIIYILLFYASFYYSEYDKELRKCFIYSSIILWIVYLIATIILNYLIK